MERMGHLRKSKAMPVITRVKSQGSESMESLVSLEDLRP